MPPLPPSPLSQPGAARSGVETWLDEASRQLAVCNACRYCEAYCPVFPALERRATTGPADVLFLANLCHDCQACYQACMYVPPHEFAVDVPRALTAVRTETYARYAWPTQVGRWLTEKGWVAAGLAAAALVLLLATSLLTGHSQEFFAANGAPGAFYRIVPFLAMLVPGLAGGAFIVVVLAGGFLSFWRASRAGERHFPAAATWLRATSESLRLVHLRGGGAECYYPDPAKASAYRRWLHTCVVTGFGGAFLSTVLAAIWQDLEGQTPPFPVLSAPVLVGILGGVLLIVGTTGLLYLKLQSRGRTPPTTMRSLDVAFLVCLDAVSISGMLTLILRTSSLLGLALDLHIACLFALYATAPYGKFAHSVYRFAAILLDVQERQDDHTLAPIGEIG